METLVEEGMLQQNGRLTRSSADASLQEMAAILKRSSTRPTRNRNYERLTRSSADASLQEIASILKRSSTRPTRNRNYGRLTPSPVDAFLQEMASRRKVYFLE